MTAIDTDHTIIIPVTGEFAADWLVRDFPIPKAQRPLRQLTLDGVDLGTWRIEKINTVRDATIGRDEVFAVLRKVWP